VAYSVSLLPLFLLRFTPLLHSTPFLAIFLLRRLLRPSSVSFPGFNREVPTRTHLCALKEIILSIGVDVKSNMTGLYSGCVSSIETIRGVNK
jgi:hypothetical protein